MAAMAVRAKGVDGYYQTNIVKITNVDDLIANSRLTSYTRTHSACR